MDVYNLCALRPENSTYQQLYIAKVPVIFFIAWGGGGRAGGGFLLRQRSTYVIPPQSIQCGFDPPSSIPATTKSQTECYYMQASDIYINTYVSWTLNNNFTYLVIWYELNCLIQIVENKAIVALVLLTVEFFIIFLISWYAVPSLSS